MRWAWTLLLGVIVFGQAQAEEFTVREAKTRLVDGVYQLDVSLDYEFSDESLEALHNGVPLTISLDMEVQRKRSWWLDEDIAVLEQRFQLYYHALADQYLLRNLNSGAVYTYPTLGTAVAALGTIRDLPLLDEKFIEKGERYEVELRARLDIESLPSPLRPVAYLTPAWRLASDWSAWSLTP